MSNALTALSSAAEAARDGRNEEVKALLRQVLADAEELAKENEAVVDKAIRTAGSAPGCSTLGREVRSAVTKARKVIAGPWEGAKAALDMPPVTDIREVLDGIDNLPERMPIPAGHAVTPGMVWRVYQQPEGPATFRPIGQGLIVCIGRAVDSETGDARLRLAWQYRGGWVQRVVPRSVVVDGRRLLGVVGDAGIPADAKTIGPVSSWLVSQEIAASPWMMTSQALSRLGWTPNMSGYLAGTESIGEPIDYLAPGPGEAQVVEGYRRSGTLDEWKAEVWDKIKMHPAGLVVLAALVPPLLPIINAPGWTLDIGGGSSTGKTTASLLAASVWGDPVVLARAWPKTWAAARSALEMTTHMPTIFDDTKNVRDKPGLIKEVLYLVAYGRSQSLGAQGGGTRRERVIGTVLISTGEAPAVTLCGDAQGATTRVLSLRKAPLPVGSKELADDVTRAARRFFGVAGPTVVQWLHDNRESWEKVRGGYEAQVKKFAVGVDDLEARAAGYIAQLQVAAWVARKALGIDVPGELFALASSCVKDGAADRDTPLSALLWCAGWWEMRPGMHGGSFRSDQQQREIIGWGLGHGKIGWAEPALRKCLEEGGFSPAEALTAWRDRGWIVCQEPGRFTSKVTVPGGDRYRLVRWTDSAAKSAGWEAPVPAGTLK